MNTSNHGTEFANLWRSIRRMPIRLALCLALAVAAGSATLYVALKRQELSHAMGAAAMRVSEPLERTPYTRAPRGVGAEQIRDSASAEQSRDADRIETEAESESEQAAGIVLDLNALTLTRQGARESLPAARDVVVDAEGGPIRVEGRPGDDAITYHATGATTGTLALEGTGTTYRIRNIGKRQIEPETPVLIHTGAGNDVLTVRLDGYGAANGYLRFDGGAGNDTLVTKGAISSGPVAETYIPGPGNSEGRIHFASLDGEPLMTVDFDGLEPVSDLVPAAGLVVNATDGNNVVTYTQGSSASNGKVSVDSFETIEFSNKTSLTVNCLNGSDTVVLSNASTPTSLTAITVNGGEGADWMDARGLAGPAVTLNGNGGEDTLIGGGTADTLNGGDGNDDLYSGPANSTVDGGANSDWLTYAGTAVGDTITYRQDSVTSLVIVTNGSTQTDSVTTMEQICIDPWDGDDIVTVTLADSLLVGTIPAMPVLVTGGSPEASDSLTVVDDSVGDLTILRRGADGQSGSVVVGPGTATGPASPVHFEGIEDVSIQGTYVEFPYDAYENNDAADEATVLGSGGTAYACIDPASDADVFKVIPAQTGLMSLRVLYTSYAVMPSGRPGLPGNGTLQYVVTDVNGNLIATAPSHVLAVAGQAYLVRVTGAGAAINAYNLVAGSTALPVPTGVSIDPPGETMTGNPRPRFIAHVDLGALVSAGAAVLTPAQAAGGVTPGVAVLVTITNTSTGSSIQGYAAQVGASTSEFSFTPAADLAPGDYTVAASVKLYDGQTTHASGQSTLSVPLDITVMSCDGLPAAANTITFGPVPAGAFVSASDGLYSGRVRVTWTEVAGASEYLVYRATSADLSGAQLLGGVTQRLFLDDYSARSVLAGGGCAPGIATPEIYYYRVFASGPCIATTTVGDDAGSAGIEDQVTQYALPAQTDLLGNQLISSLSSVSVRVPRKSSAVDSGQVWGVIHADSPLNAGNVTIGTSAKVIASDLWVTYTPAVPWQVEETITVTVGATDTGGRPLGPVTCVFKVVGAKDLRETGEALSLPPELGAAAEVRLVPVARPERLPLLENAASEPYAVLPEGPYQEPAVVWVPVAPGLDPAGVDLAYLYFDGIQTRWVRGSSVRGWLADDEARVTSSEGASYVGYAMNHSGIVALVETDNSGIVQPAAMVTLTGHSPLRGMDMMIPVVVALAGLRFMRRNRALERRRVARIRF